jgi:hypothetical protein
MCSRATFCADLLTLVDSKRAVCKRRSHRLAATSLNCTDSLARVYKFMK